MAAERGFILAITLWMLAAMAVVAALIASWSLQQVEEARGAGTRVENHAAMISNRDTLLYLLSTRATTQAGIPTRDLSADALALRRLHEFGALDRSVQGGELAVDGSAYRGLGDVDFAVQDEAGLLSFFWPDPIHIDGLLSRLGVVPEQLPIVRDSLLDFIDKDSLRRLQGAEASEYAREGKDAPPNRRLLHLSELLRIAGWQDLPLAIRDRMLNYGTVHYVGALNINAVPAALLATVAPGCVQQCQALIDARALAPFQSSRDVLARAGVMLPGEDGFDYRYAPSEVVFLTFWDERGAAWRIHVTLTPLTDHAAPWLVSSAYSLSRPPSNDLSRPTGSDLFTDAAPSQP